MLKVIIVDDEFPARQLLRMILEDMDEIEIIGEFENGEDAIQFFRKGRADVVFLDIQMYRKDGLETAGGINNLANRPFIVFTTGFTQYAVKAFELEAIDYIVKPYTEDRVYAAIKRIRELKDNTDHGLLSNDILYKQGKLPVWKNDRMFVLNYYEILYFTAFKKGKSYVYAGDKEYITDISLSEIEQKIDINRFIRVHKSFIINVDKILEIIPWFSATYVLKLKGCEEKIPVSRHYMDEFKKRMNIKQ